MTRTKKIILSILILLFVLGISGGVVYFFILVQVMYRNGPWKKLAKER